MFDGKTLPHVSLHSQFVVIHLPRSSASGGQHGAQVCPTRRGPTCAIDVWIEDYTSGAEYAPTRPCHHQTTSSTLTPPPTAHERSSQVGWPLLTPEGAPCHDRFSSGELLCELAAALDYAVSGATLYTSFVAT